MGLMDDIGLSSVINFFKSSSFVMWFGIILLAFIILIMVSGLTFFYYSRKENKNAFKYQIPLFISMNGKLKRIGLDWAKELYVPDSNISLYYLRGYKIYLARPTRAMGTNENWYAINENGEWVNIDLSLDPKKSTLADINYDHRDTRYAFVNMSEIIKRNYKDKNLVWWKDPVVMNIISFIIMSIIFVGACWFLIAKMGHLVDRIAILIDRFAPIAESFTKAFEQSQNLNSGVVST